MPWTTRERCVYQLENILDQLENILDEQELEEASRLQVREALETFKEKDLPGKGQVRLWALAKATS